MANLTLNKIETLKENPKIFSNLNLKRFVNPKIFSNPNSKRSVNPNFLNPDLKRFVNSSISGEIKTLI